MLQGNLEEMGYTQLLPIFKKLERRKAQMREKERKDNVHICA